MNKILLLLVAAFVAGCGTAPEMLPDNTTDSVIMMKLKHEITNGDKITQNWGWILWYLPVLFLVVAWAWKEFITRRCADEEEKAEVKAEQPAPQDNNTTVP
jgi:hypothetical protein